MTEAQAVYTEGNTLLTDSANDMSMGDYTGAALDHALGAAMLTEIPDEIEIIWTLTG